VLGAHDLARNLQTLGHEGRIMALRFKRVQRRHRVPAVLIRDEVKAILGLMDGTCRLMAELMYGAGLRVHECVALRVKDIDLRARTITVHSGKGGKDRTTVLAELRVASQRREARHSRATDRCFLLSWPSRFFSHWKAWIGRWATDAAGLQAVGKYLHRATNLLPPAPSYVEADSGIRQRNSTAQVVTMVVKA
jgi:integrase